MSITYLIIWILIGFIISLSDLYLLIKDTKYLEYSVSDFVLHLSIITAGPILLVFIIIDYLFDIRDLILFRSRRKK